MHDHGSVHGQKRLWAIQKFGFPNSMDALADLIFRIPSNLVQFFAVFIPFLVSIREFFSCGSVES